MIGVIAKSASTNKNVIKETPPGPAWNFKINVIIPKENVLETVSNFPVKVDMSSADKRFWENVNQDGSDIFVIDSNGEKVDSEVRFIDTIKKVCVLYFKAPVLSKDEDNVFSILYMSDETKTNDNVFSDYVVSLNGQHPSKTQGMASEDTVHYKGSTRFAPAYFTRVDIGLPSADNAGIVTDEEGEFWLTATNRLQRLDSDFNVINETDMSDLPFNLLDVGDGAIYGDLLVVPFQTDDQHVGRGIAVYDKKALTLYHYINITNIVTFNVSSCWIDIGKGYIYAVEEEQCNKILVFDISTKHLVKEIILSETLTKVTGICKVGTHYYISTHDWNKERKNILYIANSTGEIESDTGSIDNGCHGRGVTYDGEYFYWLKKSGTEDVVIKARLGTGLVFTATDYKTQNGGYRKIKLDGPKAKGYLAAWGKSYDFRQSAILSLSHSSTPNNRLTVCVDDLNGNYGTWDSNGNGWLYSDVLAYPGFPFHVGVSFVTTGKRKLFVNGKFTREDLAGAHGSSRQYLYVGAEDDTAEECFYGEIYEVRMHSDVPSNGWIKMEDLNIRTKDFISLTSQIPGPWTINDSSQQT